MVNCVIKQQCEHIIAVRVVPWSFFLFFIYFLNRWLLMLFSLIAIVQTQMACPCNAMYHNANYLNNYYCFANVHTHTYILSRSYTSSFHFKCSNVTVIQVHFALIASQSHAPWWWELLFFFALARYMSLSMCFISKHNLYKWKIPF